MRVNPRWAAGALGLCLVLAGCGGGSAEESEPDTSAETTQNSGVEGVPVPVGAEPREGFPGAWDVPDYSYADLVAWYEGELPSSQDYQDWVWCELITSDSFTQRNYTKGGQDLLAVVVFDMDPVTVSIGVDDSGPC